MLFFFNFNMQSVPTARIHFKNKEVNVMRLYKVFQSIALPICLVLLGEAFLLAFAEDALAKPKVVGSLPDFASIAEEIGGDKVEVISLAKGYQAPHFVDG